MLFNLGNEQLLYYLCCEYILHSSQMAYKLLDVNANLRELGNLDDIIPELPCSITSERAQEIVRYLWHTEMYY